MAYGLCYKLPFKDLKDQDYTVEIEKNGYTGVVTELTGSDTPFTISIDDEDFLYTPLRFSTAKIGIVGSDYLQDLFSTQYQMFRVTLLKDSEPVWCGFIKPENYSQDYVLSLFSYEVECVSAMSVMENLDYKQVRDGEMGLISLWDILKNIITRSQARFRNVYVPHVYAKDEAAYEAGDNVLAEMTISEQNFFDENGKAMTCKDVLEAVCYFLNWTCVDWQGSLYFIDIDHTGDYYKYISDLSSFEMADINSATVQDEGFNGDGHTLDILGGYNKVTVKCSNYPIESLFKEINYNSLDLFTRDGAWDVRENNDPNTAESVMIYKYSPYDIPGWKLYNFTNNGYILKDLEALKSQIDPKDNTTKAIGALPAKIQGYKKQQDPKDHTDITYTSTFNYDNVIWVRTRNTDPIGWPFDIDALLVRRGAPFLFSDGYLVLTGGILPVFQDHVYPFENTKELISAEKDKGYRFSIKAVISIGDYILEPNEAGTFFKWVKKGTEKIGEITVFTEYSTDTKVNSFLNIANTSPVLMLSSSGFTIFPPETPVYGEPAIMLYGYIHCDGNYKAGDPYGFIIKDLKISFLKKKSEVPTENTNDDRIYENVINSDYINKLKDITFKITSNHPEDGAMYSKVLYDGEYLQDNLYNVLTINKRPEELLITRIINRYDHTSIKLTQEINFTGHIQPFTRMKDEYAPMAGKTFIPTGGEIDVAARRYKCIMIEL